MIGRIVPSILAAGLLVVLAGQQSFAQYPYPTGDAGAGGVSNSTLQQCANLNIDRNQCSDSAVLLKERINLAMSSQTKGSGTPMLATQSGQLALFVGALGAIFGGVATAFFISGKKTKGQIIP